MSRVLIVDDEHAICKAFEKILRLEGHTPLIAASGQEALDLARGQRPDAVFLDIQMPGMDGLETLERLQAEHAGLPVVVMTAYGTVQTAMEAVRLGAFEYLGKPLDIDQIRSLLRRALDQGRSSGNDESETAPVAAAVPGERELIGQSPAMQEVFKLMGLLTSNDLTVLISGESGVGKELVARGIHDNSDRAKKPFVAVNCAAIPEQLMESELFGHEKGAFTGASQQRQGRFEAAGAGTLFLDEIGEMNYEVQSKLLRVLQERHFERVGSSHPIPLKARILTATNRDLRQEVARRRFREDLFHRINLVNLHIPPLRKRTGDIELLALRFLAGANQELNRQVTGIEPDALELLRGQSWPGNVRELENLIRKTVLLTQGTRITRNDLQSENVHSPDAPQSAEKAKDRADNRLQQAMREALRQRLESDSHSQGAVFHEITGLIEQALIDEALRLTGDNQVAASRLLGINRTTLRKKMR